MNIAKLLERAATFGKSAVSVRSGATVTKKSFPELVADVRALQRHLRDIGVEAGHVIGIQASAKYEFIVWDLALIGIGAVPHVFPEEWSISEMRARGEKAKLAFLVSAQAGTLILPSETDPTYLHDAIRVSPSAVRVEDRDLLTHVYSSGTTGAYKGLLISRSGAEALGREFIDAFAIDSDDRYLFFLPFSHFQQRLGLYTCLESGTSLMYTPHTHVFHDIRTFRPTFLIGPPVFYETALATLASRGQRSPGTLMAGLGGNVRFMITGMAPIRRNVLEAYGRQGVQLLEAYGITEVGLVAWNTPGDNHIGTVGRPLKHHNVTLAEDSEILVRADSPLSKGYFDVAEDETARTFLSDGYIATGDIGEFNGPRLVLKGRKKDIIVTGGGAKFHPLELEQRILTCVAVRQAVVINDWDQGGGVVAVISVDDPHDEQTIELVDRVVEGINASVPSYKRIGRTVVTRTRFTQDNGMLTRTLKPNRSAIARHFTKQAPMPLALTAS